MGPDAMILDFWLLSYKPALLLENQNAVVNKLCVCVCVSSVVSDSLWCQEP